MRDDGVGRVLVASLHEGISESLPERLSFYESWLSPQNLRGGGIGRAPVMAVLSFLRKEGEGYHRVMTRAGECAADWTVEAMPWTTRRLIRAAPAWIRVRLLMSLARRIVRDTYRGTGSASRVRRGVARLELRESIFCTVREASTGPLCDFYAAVVSRLMTLFALDLAATATECRAMGAPLCVLTASSSGSASRDAS